jgi:hypothetical protein
VLTENRDVLVSLALLEEPAEESEAPDVDRVDLGWLVLSWAAEGSSSRSTTCMSLPLSRLSEAPRSTGEALIPDGYQETP